MLSQNVLFEGESIGDRPYDCPGEGILQRVSNSLQAKGFSLGEIEAWHGGWSIELKVHDARLQIALASVSHPSLWMAQIASLDQPGPLRRLFGARLLGQASELIEIASAVHLALIEAGCVKLRWCIDDYPDEFNSSPEPRRG